MTAATPLEMMASTRSITRAVPLAAALLLATAMTAAAQQPSPAGSSVLDGAFTIEQAARGKEQFARNCAECHVHQEFTGNAFMRAWRGRRVFDLFDLIRTTMPMSNPGKLNAQVYADIIAYLLEINELPAGTTPLPGDDEALKSIHMPPRP